MFLYCNISKAACFLTSKNKYRVLLFEVVTSYLIPNVEVTDTCLNYCILGTKHIVDSFCIEFIGKQVNHTLVLVYDIYFCGLYHGVCIPNSKINSVTFFFVSLTLNTPFLPILYHFKFKMR